jgi:hypothetical protein
MSRMSSAPFAATRLAVVGRAVALVAAVALAVSGCGSSGGSSGSGGGSGGATTAPPSSSAPAGPSPTGAPLAAADVAQIKTAYRTLFAAGTDPAKAATVLQHGDQLKAALAKNATSPEARGLTVQVTRVVADPSNPNVAKTTFTLLSGGKAVLPGTPGYAVKEGGTWKVAATTFCQLLSLQQAAPAQCHDASITAFPSA